MEQFRFTGKTMKEELELGDDMEDELETRNECILSILSQINTHEINAPFPFVGYDEDTFIHYELTRYSARVGIREPLIPDEAILHSIAWFIHFMWCNIEMPFVHGDMTESNIV
jgi:hypothetical protein